MNNNYGSPYENPFNTGIKYMGGRPVLQRNYDEVFDASKYEGKDTIELETYARNLHNYLMDRDWETGLPPIYLIPV